MRGFVWADADVPQAAAFIREVALNRDAAAEKGRAARRDMLATRLPGHTGIGMRERLQAIRRGDPPPR
jgi:hypothetical protein